MLDMHTEIEMGSHRKESWDARGAPAKARNFPREAYTYEDDVTPEAVAKLRERARPVIDADEWAVIDGFGRVIYT